MTSQRIILGDCLEVFANEKNVPAFVSDPPGHVGKNGFMNRSWDRGHLVDDLVLRMPARSKEHERELRREEGFIRYWAQRYAMAYDIADAHATNIVWTLPRTSYQTATALRAAGWDIKDNLVHLFGSGWAKTGNALAPGQEGWILATKGKPELDIDACRVPRGERPSVLDGGRMGYGGGSEGYDYHPNERGSLPKNAVLSHCEGCVRVGIKMVKASAPPGKPTAGTIQKDGSNAYGNGKPRGTSQYGDGAEPTPAFHCLAGCVCGARTPWPDDQPLPRCPCGETWRWLCPVAEINTQSGNRPGMSGGGKHRADYAGGLFGGIDCDTTIYADQGGSARFFNTFKYLSKCSPSERHAGCESLYWKADKKDPFGFVQVTREEWEAIKPHPLEGRSGSRNGAQRAREHAQDERAHGNVHPTVKSYRLMHWLHSLTGAPRILDLTAGSGTGMYTAFLDGIEWLGAEICPQAIVIAEARLAFWKGLSFEARNAFMQDDEVPERIEGPKAQLSLL